MGGVASPILANLTLDGLETVIRQSIKIRKDQVNFIRYADDFIVTARTRETLEEKVKPAIVAFLARRGLQLSEEKTLITHISEGFNFLGQNVRKYGTKLLITPAKSSVKAVLEKIRFVITKGLHLPVAALIRKLNPIIRGWANYHRHVVSSKAYRKVDGFVYYSLMRWAKRRHPKKTKGWIYCKYFLPRGQKDGFHAWVKNKAGERRLLRLYRATRTGIERHIKVKGEANPYDPQYVEYFRKRRCFVHRTYYGGKPVQQDTAVL